MISLAPKSMKTLILIALAFLLLLGVKRLVAGKVLSPEETGTLLANENVVLVDVREPSEWERGVIQGALLLPLSDLNGERREWKAFLETHKDSEVLLYCRSGNRSGIAARILEKEGIKVRNVGAFSSLSKTLPTAEWKPEAR